MEDDKDQNEEQTVDYVPEEDTVNDLGDTADYVPYEKQLEAAEAHKKRLELVARDK